MMKFVAAKATGLCPEPRDFFRHGNIPKKPKKEKAGAKRFGLFGLWREYSLNGCVPALPFSASPSIEKYIVSRKISSDLNQEKAACLLL